MIKTRITDMFSIDYPIMSSPMSEHSGGTLAAAVSKAGGLGLFGGSTGRGPGWIREQCALVRSNTDAPFGVGFITHLLPMHRDIFEVVLDEKVPVVAFSFADPLPWMDGAKESGATVICQVQTVGAAEHAVAAGADILVAQGNEAGGHTGAMNLLPFLCQLLDRFPDVPIMAAGGIAGRVYNNGFVREWHRRENDLVQNVGEAMEAVSEAEVRDDRDVRASYMGESAAFVDSVRPAVDVLSSVCEEAEAHLGNLAARVGS